MRIDRASPRAECRIFGWCGSTSMVRKSQCSMGGTLILRGVAQPVDGLADDARDVHLADADALPDLGLREVLGEAQAQHLALALVEHAHQALDRRRVLRDGEPRVLDAVDGPDALAGLLVLLARAVERHRAVGAGGLARLQYVLDGRARALRDLGGRRRAAELARELLAARLELDRELLQVARDAHRPAAVAEVALELAQDGGDGETRERRLATWVKAVDRLQQAEAGDLDQVVQRLSPALVAAGELAGERQEATDQRGAGRLVAVVGALQQRAVGTRPGHTRFGVGRIGSRRVVEVLQSRKLF